MGLPKIIEIDKEKCVNCHQCITACSTKFANNGAGDVVEINDDLCIGCGECIKACTHDARIPVDDFNDALAALKRKEKIVAIIAPAVAANFPEKFLHLNGWLKSLGVKALFDVSFGAELTVKSYLNHIQKNNPGTVIAQPCPAIVTYIEVYQPELIQFLAPADSPMLHTIKMIRNFYPAFKNSKVMVVSPCLAKKREFEEVGMGDFNVTMRRIEKYLDDNGIQLSEFPKTDFDNDPAERAVLFSTPGGLLATAEREIPSIRYSTRKIEGPQLMYHYLKLLPEQIEKNRSPLLLDCLNCENGCNGGTGTSNQQKSADELEFFIHKRRKELQERYQTTDNEKQSIEKLNTVIRKYWSEGIYNRSYTNRQDLYTNFIKQPTKEEITGVYESMHKYSDEDIINCSSCGYHSCEMMATAIYNKLNKKENCHFYLAYENNLKSEALKIQNERVEIQKTELIEQSENLLAFIQKLRQYVNEN